MFLKSVFTFIKGMLPIISKSSVYQDLKIKAQSLDEDIIPAYANYALTASKSNFLSNVSIAYNNKYYRLSKLPKTGPKNFLINIKGSLNNFRTNLDILKDLVDTNLESSTSTSVAPVKKAAILKAVSEMTACVRYLLPLLMYIVDCEMVARSKNNNWKPLAIQEKKIATSFDAFIASMNVYCVDPNEFKKAFNELPDLNVDEDNAELADIVSGKKGSNLLDTGDVKLRGFLGNPIYHMKMNAVENQVEDYKCNQEMKKCLELKVMWLTEEFKNNPDPDIEKEIEYLNNNIQELQYEIDQMEEMVK